jgi:predicted TIM-barrel fold metal-dependent hydrolase
MGLARGIFTVDNHVIPQIGNSVYQGDDPESMLLYHMDRYGVDVCVLKSHGGYYSHGVDKNQLIQQMVKRHPDRFVALCADVETQRKEAAGEEAWNIDNAVKELDELLSTGLYAGIGEGFPRDRNIRKKLASWDERLEEICKVADLCRKYKKPLHWITGSSIGGTTWRNDIVRNVTHPDHFENSSPMLAIEIAAWYPEVPIILSHAGVEGSGYYMDFYEKSLYVAAHHRNVFLDCGQWWTELFDKPLQDINIGAGKLLWGSGWGQPNLTQQRMPGQIPETYTAVDMTKGGYAGTKHTINIWGWSLSQIGRLNVPQDDLDLIMGGNAVHLFNIKTPLPADKLFKPVERDYLNSEVPPRR